MGLVQILCQKMLKIGNSIRILLLFVVVVVVVIGQPLEAELMET